MATAHASNHGSDLDIEHHVKVYVRVFFALLLLTGVTVGASYIDLGHGLNIIVALLIALVKGSLVACYFMHLISERKLIYWALILTVIFFAVLLALPTMWQGDGISLH